MKKKQVNLSVGRGDKLSVSKGAGLTAKGRAKYNRETGSDLKHLTLTLTILATSLSAPVVRAGKANVAKLPEPDGTAVKSYGYRAGSPEQLAHIAH